MAGRQILVTAVLAAGLHVAAQPAAAQGGKVQVLTGQPAAQAASVTRNAEGSGVTIYRGPAVVPPPLPTATSQAPEPVAVIDGMRIRIDRLEPTGNWFIDRSGHRPVLVHCYTRQSTQVGGGRRILCDARRL